MILISASGEKYWRFDLLPLAWHEPLPVSTDDMIWHSYSTYVGVRGSSESHGLSAKDRPLSLMQHFEDEVDSLCDGFTRLISEAAAFAYANIDERDFKVTGRSHDELTSVVSVEFSRVTVPEHCSWANGVLVRNVDLETFVRGLRCEAANLSRSWKQHLGGVGGEES